MKRLKILLTTGILTASMLSSVSVLASEDLYGAAKAAGDMDLTVEEMMTYAIQDEYLAHAEYELILEKFGSVRPFSNIVKAEAVHISLLENLFGDQNLKVPEDTAAERIVLPSALSDTYSHGVEAEILNIAMYERFLKEELPADVKVTFERLKAASEKHLAAFERASAPTEGTIDPKLAGNTSPRQTAGGGGRLQNARPRSGASRGQNFRGFCPK